MPTVPRKGVKSVYVEFEQEVYDQMAALATGNNRGFKAELMLACKRHLAEPQVILTPPLNPPKRKRTKE